MLPKIVLASTPDRESLLSSLGLSSVSTMNYEGSEGKIDDLRHFINFGVGVSGGFDLLNLVIWDADRLSPECQAVLLKPLEESTEGMCLYLVASNENGLLSTIMSRCVVVDNGLVRKEKKEVYWKKVLECFTQGPAKCLAFADELEKEEMESLLEEMIAKLKSGLDDQVNKNRLKILKLSIECLQRIRYTNVNAKLFFGNFLVSSWKLVRK